MQPQFAIAPAIMLLVIGLAMLFAVMIVVVSLIKAGKGTVVVALVLLVPAGLILVALLLPMYRLRSVASHQAMQVRMQEDAARQQAEMRQWELAPPTVQPAIVVHAQPAPTLPKELVAIAPEVTSDSEMQIDQPPSPSEESSASSNESTESTAPQAVENDSASPSQFEAEAPPKWTTEPEGPMADGSYVIPVKIGEYSSPEEIQRELLPSIRSALHSYMAQFIDHHAAELIQLPPGYVVDHGIVADRWSGIRTDSLAGVPMHSMWLKLRFDDHVRRDLQARLEQAKVTHRLSAFGLGGGLLLALLGTLYGYLKLDTATKGFYSGRLRLAAILAGLSAAGAAGLVAERIVMWV